MSQVSENPTIVKKPKLLDQVRHALRTKHYAMKTEEAYVHWIQGVRYLLHLIIICLKYNLENIKIIENRKYSISPPKRYILFHNKRHPKEMGEKEINEFLTHLAVKEKVAASTQNQALSAIVFLYKHILKIELGNFGNVVWAKKPSKLPVVFNREEVTKVLNQLSGTNLIMAMLLYGGGLRLSECLQLHVKDIDFQYKQIIVRSAKGDKDRVTLLPEYVIEPLEKHLNYVKLLHEKDLKAGYDSVYMPYALERKYPNAGREFGWKFTP